jgi:hypothetical protein
VFTFRSVWEETVDSEEEATVEEAAEDPVAEVAEEAIEFVEEATEDEVATEEVTFPQPVRAPTAKLEIRTMPLRVSFLEGDRRLAETDFIKIPPFPSSL